MSKVELIQIVAILTGIFLSIINAVETRLINRFVRRGATSSGAAIDLTNPKPLVGRLLARFQRAGVIVITNQGKYYIDQDVYKEFQKKRRITFISAVLIIMATVFVTIMLMN